jgi:hypothetical protein
MTFPYGTALFVIFKKQAMLKKEARKIYKEKRVQLSEAERSKMDDLMLIQFQTVELPFIESLRSYTFIYRVFKIQKP